MEKISAIMWLVITSQCNHNASLLIHSGCVLRLPEVWRKSVSISCNVYSGVTRESTGLYTLKMEWFRSRMKSSTEKVIPWAGDLVLAMVLRHWNAACITC